MNNFTEEYVYIIPTGQHKIKRDGVIPPRFLVKRDVYERNLRELEAGNQAHGLKRKLYPSIDFEVEYGYNQRGGKLGDPIENATNSGDTRNFDAELAEAMEVEKAKQKEIIDAAVAQAVAQAVANLKPQKS
jgi:hypothetical protein